MEMIINNAQIVLDNEVMLGSIQIKDGMIAAIDSVTNLPNVVDCRGDYLAPGMIELHTDNLEKHYLPRPGVFWPDILGAFVAHDRHMLTSGVTTVYDALRNYDSKHDISRQDALLDKAFQSLKDAKQNNALLCDHFIHMRCEVSEPDMFEHVGGFLDDDLVRLVSIMDHTPGQRQWRQLDKFHQYNTGRGMSREESEERVTRIQEESSKNIAKNTFALLDKCRELNKPIASHDDTTVEHVNEAKRYGVCISEFPTTLEAAEEAKRQSLSTVMGAPNIVRSGSHSGNVAASELFTKGLLDILSSDYNPNSLIQAVFKLAQDFGKPLNETFKLVCQNPAKVAQLNDRGSIEIGKRADLICIHQIKNTPIVRKAWVEGELLF